MILARRSFLVGAAASLLTAPAIVRAGSLMPVKAVAVDVDIYALVAEMLRRQMADMEAITAAVYRDLMVYGEGSAQIGGVSYMVRNLARNAPDVVVI